MNYQSSQSPTSDPDIHVSASPGSAVIVGYEEDPARNQKMMDVDLEMELTDSNDYDKVEKKQRNHPSNVITVKRVGIALLGLGVMLGIALGVNSAAGKSSNPPGRAVTEGTSPVVVVAPSSTPSAAPVVAIDQGASAKVTPTTSPTNSPTLIYLDDDSLPKAVKDNMDNGGVAYGPVKDWRTERVTDMSELFKSRPTFNGDISQWDVSRVTDMSYMFYAAENFDSEIEQWDVSKVTFMNSMFAYAKSFNRDLNEWDVAEVTTMDSMFYNASSFEQDLCWDEFAVTTHMFKNCPTLSLLDYNVCSS